MDLRENNNKFVDYASAHPWETARLDFIKRLLVKHHPQASNVLDFGCGNCFVADKLEKELGLCLTGIDHAFNDDLLPKLRREIAGRRIALYRNLEDIPSDADNYDTVLLMDLLEHIDADYLLLQALMHDPRIAAGATFIITVPAFNSLFCKHDHKLGHVRRYTLSQMRGKAEACGAEIIDGGYFFASLLQPRILRVLIEKMGGSDNTITAVDATGEWNKWPALTKMVVFCLNMDILLSRLLRKINIIIPGLSCYLICRKPR